MNIKRQWIFRLTFSVVVAASILVAGCEKMLIVDDIKPLRPNFLIVVTDDMGYSDIGAFGGEIETPNLDTLAFGGLRLTDFHTAAACAPTRAMLMTGKDSHYAGVGTVEFTMPAQRGQPGYRLFLDEEIPTLAEQLRLAGYHTMMSGKWHLGKGEGHRPFDRGFETSFALLNGGHNHYNKEMLGPRAQYHYNGVAVQWPEGAYSSDYFAEQMVDMLKENREEDRPFFAYLTFTAPHWPLQAPAETMAKYRGHYDDGPAVLRNERLKQQLKLGLLDPDINAHEIEELPDWNSLTEAQRTYEARKMEIHAAMVDRADQGIGQVLNELRDSGALENTVVIFLSDNGAEGMFADKDGKWGFYEIAKALATAGVKLPEIDNSIDNLGQSGSFVSIGKSWAQATMAPFRRYKSMPTEGGIHSPAFISGPGIPKGQISNALLHVSDIYPTLLDMADITLPIAEKNSNDGSQSGHSWTPLLAGTADHVYSNDDSIGWEFYGGSALRRGDWKAVYVQSVDFSTVDHWGPGFWELFNMRTDPGETTDLAEQHPDILEELVIAWHAYAKANNVVVLFPDSQGVEALGQPH